VAEFELCIQREADDLPAKAKLVARNGRTAQDVALTFMPGLDVDVAILREIIAEALERRARGDDYDEDVVGTLESEGPLNPSAQEMMESRRRDNVSRMKASHEKDVAKRRAHERQKLVKEKQKKLASSSAARERNLDIDAHAEKWADEERGDAEVGRHWGGGRSKRIEQAVGRERSSR